MTRSRPKHSPPRAQLAPPPSRSPSGVHTSAAHQSGQRGFTMIEMAIVGLIITVIAAIGIPALFHVLRKAKLEGLTRELAIDLQVARQESIKRGVPVVVQFTAGTSTTPASLLAFANVIDDPLPAPELTYNPDPDPAAAPPTPQGTYDPLVVQYEFPTNTTEQLRIDYADPNSMPFDGFSTRGTETVPIIVFEPDGSVRDTGGFRFGDFRPPLGDYSSRVCANCFEVRVAPAATAKVTIQKYVHSTGAYLPSGRRSNQNLWEWY